MDILDALPFAAGVWAVDAEFTQPDGFPLPTQVHCLVARELRSGQTFRLWEDELWRLSAPPFPHGSDALFVCHNAIAEISVFKTLGWTLPTNVYDTYAEFRLLTNRVKLEGVPPISAKLSDAVRYLGLHHLSGADKPELQQLAMRGAPFTDNEREALLVYCEHDVLALAAMLPALLSRLLTVHADSHRYLGRALIRGNYMRALTTVVQNGIPLDTDTLADIRLHWNTIKLELIQRVGEVFPVYDGLTFKQSLFEQYLNRQGIAWPRTPSGRLATDDDTWKTMALRYPKLQPLRELVCTLGQLKLNGLQVGPDGRNRCWLGPFRASTSRNQPSSSAFLFGPATWIRGLAKPPPGQALVYCDWSAQEIGIAGALSGDENLMADYQSGDPYLGFGKAIGYVPDSATKHSHPFERDVLKRVLLATGYGMGVEKMAAELDKTEFEVAQILRQHRWRYATFWDWIDREIASSLVRGFMRTRLGWQMAVVEGGRPTSLLNWHMQSAGAEMMRLAIIMAVEAGLKICAPVHDALLMEAPIAELDDHVTQLRDIMTRASEIVLDGFSIRVGVDVIQYPKRYTDPRGLSTWNTVMDIVDELRPLAA